MSRILMWMMIPAIVLEGALFDLFGGLGFCIATAILVLATLLIHRWYDKW